MKFLEQTVEQLRKYQEYERKQPKKERRTVDVGTEIRAEAKEMAIESYSIEILRKIDNCDINDVWKYHGILKRKVARQYGQPVVECPVCGSSDTYIGVNNPQLSIRTSKQLVVYCHGCKGHKKYIVNI